MSAAAKDDGPSHGAVAQLSGRITAGPWAAGNSHDTSRSPPAIDITFIVMTAWIRHNDKQYGGDAVKITFWLKVTLAAVAVFTVWTGLAPTVLGENGLQLGRGMTPFLPAQTAVTIPVVPDRGYAARAGDKPAVAQVFTWKDTSDGTKDAATGLPPVELGAWRLDLALWDPPMRDRLLYSAPYLLLYAMTLLVVTLLWRMVSSLSAGEVFTRVNAHRMLAIGITVGAGGMLFQLLRDWAWSQVISHSAAAGIVQLQHSFNLLPLAVGVVILLVAEVFRQGVRMRTEIAGLV